MEGYGCCLSWLPMLLHKQKREQQRGPHSQERGTQTNQERATQTDEETLEHGAKADAVEEAKGAVAEAGPGLLTWMCCSCNAGCLHAEEEIIIPAKQEMSLPVLLAQPTSEKVCGKENAELANQDASSINNREEVQPDFTGVWQVERTEQQTDFLKAISVNSLLAAVAGQVGITYTMEHKNDEISGTIELKLPSWPRLPTAPPKRPMSMKIGAPEMLTMDDAGREFMMLNPTWQGAKLVSGIEYLKFPHKLTLKRYMEEGRMVEHMYYPSKGLEMRRIFRKVA